MQFTLSSAEGLPIRGDLDVPAKAAAVVVIVHGFKGFKDWGFFPWLAQRLVSHSLAVCRFNMSRSGIGDDPESFDRLDLFADDTWSTQLNDLRTVVAWVRERLPELPVFLLGHSRGGGVAILGAREVPRLKGVIAWSPVSHADRWDAESVRAWNERGWVEVVNARTQQRMRSNRVLYDDFQANREALDIPRAAASLEVQLLVIHGGRDESVPADEGRSLASSTGLGSLCVIETASHTFNAIHPLVHVPFELSLAAEVSAHFVHAWARR
jgi:dienelactone hydrolase